MQIFSKIKASIGNFQLTILEISLWSLVFGMKIYYFPVLPNSTFFDCSDFLKNKQE